MMRLFQRQVAHLTAVARISGQKRRRRACPPPKVGMEVRLGLLLEYRPAPALPTTLPFAMPASWALPFVITTTLPFAMPASWALPFLITTPWWQHQHQLAVQVRNTSSSELECAVSLALTTVHGVVRLAWLPLDEAAFFPDAQISEQCLLRHGSHSLFA